MSLLHLPESFALSRRLKVIATEFCDAEGIAWIDDLERDSTIRGIYYAHLIRKVRAASKEKGQGKLHHGVLFHRDNAPAHMSSQALAAIQNVEFELLPHPLYSSDLAPSNFYLFPKLKEFMKGCKFADNEDVICAANGCWKTKIKDSSTTESKLWRNAGSSTFQLKETMLKSDKI